MTSSIRAGMGRTTGILSSVAAIAVLAGGTPAVAREDYCINPQTRQVDRQATLAYRQLEANRNPRFMSILAGLWFHQTRNPSTGQTDSQYQRFEQNGLWSYQDQVCTAQGFCTRYSGTGLFAVRVDPNVQSGFIGAIIVSDSNRNHQCINFSGRFLNRNQFVDSTNTVSQRVQ